MGDTVSGWQGENGAGGCGMSAGGEDRARVCVWVKIRFEVKLIRILLVPLRPQKRG